MSADATFLAWAIDITLGLLLLAVAVASGRLLKGPSNADRVVALDLVTLLALALTAALELRTDQTAFLDVGIALALVAFLGTVAYARLIERHTAAEEDRGSESDAP